MNIKSNYYGDTQWRLLGFVIVLTSAFTCAWRDLTIHVGKLSLLWLQLSFWNERSGSLKVKCAGIRLRVCIFERQVFHHTILPLTNWAWHWQHPWRRKYLGWFFNSYTQLVWKISKRFVDRRYDKKWEQMKAKDTRWAGITGNQLLEYR